MKIQYLKIIVLRVHNFTRRYIIQRNISSIFSGNSEAEASALIEYIEEILLLN